MATTITGGTATPGGPKGPLGPPGVPKGRAGPVPRFLNKASGRMESAQAMRTYRPPDARQQAAQKIANTKSATSAAGGHGGAKAPAKSWLDMNPSELHSYATRSVQQNTQAELQPYRQKAGEIAGTEQAVQGRYAGYGQATDQQLAGLQTQAAEGAKTYNNQLADTVLKAQQSVEQTGQNAQAQNAGYLDPQLRTALTAQKGNVSETGVAAQTAGQGLGQNEQNFMANLRAAAAQRVQEGKGNIASTYGKQQTANSQAQNQLLGRVPGAITKLETELGQKQFTNRATEAGLGLKQGDLRVKESDLGVKAAAVKGQERGRSVTERGQNINKELGEKRLSLDEWAKRESNAVAKLNATDKARYDEAQTRYKRFQETHGGKAPNEKEGRGYMAKLSTAEAIARQALGNQRQGGKAEKHAKEEEVRKQLQAKGATGDIISAALNLAVYGRLGPSDQATAISYGLTPNLRPQWFRTH